MDSERSRRILPDPPKTPGVPDPFKLIRDQLDYLESATGQPFMNRDVHEAPLARAAVDAKKPQKMPDLSGVPVLRRNPDGTIDHIDSRLLTDPKWTDRPVSEYPSMGPASPEETSNLINEIKPGQTIVLDGIGGSVVTDYTEFQARLRSGSPEYGWLTPYDSKVEKEKTNRSWHDEIVRINCHVSHEIDTNQGRVGMLPPDFIANRSPEYELLRRLWKLETVIPAPNNASGFDPRAVDRYRIQKSQVFKTIANQMDRSRQYRLLLRAMNVLQKRRLDLPTTSHLIADISALYTILGERGFVVGVKDVPHKKRIDLPEPRSLWAIRYCNVYMAVAELIGEKELPVVPIKPLHPEEIGKLKKPASKESIDDILKRAYYGQKYLVPLGGAEIFVKNSGDVEKLFLLQSGTKVFARLFFNKGEALVWIDTEDADWFSSLDMTERAMSGVSSKEPRSVWAEFVAEVYHDLVTAVELPVERQKALTYGSQKEIKRGLKNRPTIYIPRVVKVGNKQSELARPEYQGPKRSAVPHDVPAHPRKRPMTERHRQVLLAWFAERDIPMPHIAEGYTYVRPHVSPSATPEEVRSLPKFIRRRMSERFEEQPKKN